MSDHNSGVAQIASTTAEVNITTNTQHHSTVTCRVYSTSTAGNGSPRMIVATRVMNGSAPDRSERAKTMNSAAGIAAGGTYNAYNPPPMTTSPYNAAALAPNTSHAHVRRASSAPHSEIASNQTSASH